jgi:tetratricopeptide (TPR) repeat protein
VLVTSRNHLPGLVTDGATAVTLDVLTPEEASEMLAQRLGEKRVAAEPEAVRKIITSCARLPLALAIIAAGAADHPEFSLAVFAEELDHGRDGLTTLAADEPATDLRAVFSWSYDALADEAARVFRLLGLHPGPDISVPAAASLAGVPLQQARNALAALSHANLVRQHLPGRYAFHDLLRAYASELVRAGDPAAEREEAVRRILDHYLHTVWAASLLADPSQEPITLSPVRTGVIIADISGSRQALTWFNAERAVLLAAVDQAAEAGLSSAAIQLAWGLGTFLYRQGYWHDMVRVMRSAAASARVLADAQALGRIQGFLAQAYIQVGDFEDARTELLQALDLYDHPGGESRRAAIHVHFARIQELQGDYNDALRHSLESLELYRAANDQDGEAVALNSVGWYCAQLNDYTQAITYCQQSLDLFEALDDQQGQANAWDSLGYAHDHLGHHERAIACYQYAVSLNRDLGVRYSEAESLNHLGDAYHSTSDLASAHEAWQDALAILEDLNHPEAEQIRNKIL